MEMAMTTDSLTAEATSSLARPRSRALTITLWTLQILAAAAFLAAGTFKLTGAPMMVQIFDHIGIGQWFRYATGSVEVIGGILLLIPSLAAFGGLLLAVTMASAIAIHLLVIGGNPAPAIVLFAITATIAVLRRDRFRSVFGR
jgi:hypothetical protein